MTALAPVGAHVVSVQVIKTLIILVVLVVGFRLLGKREAAQLNVYDLAMLMALANAVQNSMTGGLGNLPVGLATSSAILIAAFVVTRVTARRPRLQQRLIGSPTLLVNHGQVLAVPMRRQRVSSDDLTAACRRSGLAGPEDAELAVLEVDGSISIVPRTRVGPTIDPPGPPRRRRTRGPAEPDAPSRRRPGRPPQSRRSQSRGHPEQAPRPATPYPEPPADDPSDPSDPAGPPAAP